MADRPDPFPTAFRHSPEGRPWIETALPAGHPEVEDGGAGAAARPVGTARAVEAREFLLRAPVDRRRFLRLAGAAGGAVLGSALLRRSGVGEARAGTTLWSDPATWGGRVPGRRDVAVISEGTVVLDVDARVGGVLVRRGAALEFSESHTLATRGNVIVRGRLSMSPAPDQVHTLRFEDVDESRFAGGGHRVRSTDVGLWVVGEGVLDVNGTPRRAWVRAAHDLRAGDTTVALDAAPEGWQPGDQVAVVPTAPGDYSGFEVRRVASVDLAAASVTLVSPLSADHPAVSLPDGRILGAEVLNLTRNARIEGMPGGRAHVHIMSMRPQTIRYAGLRHLGPRRRGEPVLGRYALHFHEAGDGSRGSLVEGVVARDLGNHAFVPHESHGVTFRRCVAYRVQEDPYWWDRLRPGARPGSVRPEDAVHTDDALFEECVAANVYYRRGRDRSRNGFMHNFGMGNAAVGCVAVGVRAPHGGSGYLWPAPPPGTREAAVWRHEGCVAHNVQGPGSRVWQNGPITHLITGLTAYRCRVGISHGAYRNVYRYRDGMVAGADVAALELVASGGTDLAGTAQQRFDRMTFDAGGGDFAVWIRRHSLAGARPGVLQDCRLTGFRRSAVLVDENTSSLVSRGGSYDFVRCTVDDRDLEPADFQVRDIHPDSVLRVQRRDGSAFRITRGGVAEIDPFGS